ncbi:hypothetical protein MATL_G00126640 [Megalops atlanticus]|uniref:C2H2-type domain-containing protein n=1 Tax=Megalops atlanticus TaxID=7932 RepID=A0A9D3T3K3_MEGAT|nr:hypothetical protein MATL_G00126640 [Megalops atlanticus]
MCWMEGGAMETATRPISEQKSAEGGVFMTKQPELSTPQKTAPASAPQSVEGEIKMGEMHESLSVRKEIAAKKDRLEPLKIDMTKLVPVPPTSAQLSLQCLECHIIFSDHKSKERHLKLSHPAEYEQCMLGDALFACYVCDRHFTCSSELMVHQRAHTEKQPFKCPICGEAFRRSSELTLHKKVHFGAHGYTCSDCGKPCKTLTLLKYHRRTHTGERPYVCKECGKRFSMSKALQKHLLTHSQGETEGVSGRTVLLSATADTTRIDKLLPHTATAQGKPDVTFSCSLCNVTFKTAKTRQQHMKLKHSLGRDTTHNSVTLKVNQNMGQPMETKTEAHQPTQHMETFGQGQTLQQIETLGQEQMQELIDTLGQEQLGGGVEKMGREQLQAQKETTAQEKTEVQTTETEETRGKIETLELEQIPEQVSGPGQTQGDIKTLELVQTEDQSKTSDVEQTQLQIETLALELPQGPIETMVLQQTEGHVQIQLEHSNEQLKAIGLGETHLHVNTLVLEQTHPEMETVELELTPVQMETLELEQTQVHMETVALELTTVQMETLELDQTQAQIETMQLEQTQNQTETLEQVEKQPLKERKGEEERPQQIETEEHGETCHKLEPMQQVSDKSLGQREQTSTQTQQMNKPISLSSIQAKGPEQNASHQHESQSHTIQLQHLPKHPEDAHIQQLHQEKQMPVRSVAEFVKGGHRTQSKKKMEGQLTNHSQPTERERGFLGLRRQEEEPTQHPETRLKAKHTKHSRLKKDRLIVRFVAPEKVKQSSKQKPLPANQVQQKDGQGHKLQKMQVAPQKLQLQQKAAKEKKVKKQENLKKMVKTQTLLQDKMLHREFQQMPKVKEQKQTLLQKKKEQTQKGATGQRQPEQKKEPASPQIQKKKKQAQMSRKVQLKKKEEEMPPKKKLKRKQEKVQGHNKLQSRIPEDKEQQSLLLLKGHKQPQLKVHKLDPSKTQGQPQQPLPSQSQMGKPQQKQQKVTKGQHQKTRTNQQRQKLTRQPKTNKQQDVPLLPAQVPPSSSSVVQIKSKTNRKRKAPSNGAAETALGSPHARRALGCEHCGERFSEVAALEEHLTAAHPLGIRPGECNSNGNVYSDSSRIEGETALGFCAKMLSQQTSDEQLGLTNMREPEVGKTLALPSPGVSCLQNREGDGVKVIGLSLTLDPIQAPKPSDAVLGSTIHPDNFGMRAATDWDMEAEMGEIGLGDRVERVSFPALNPSPSLSLGPVCLESEGKEGGEINGESLTETTPNVTSGLHPKSGHLQESKAQQGEEMNEFMKSSKNCVEEISRERVLSGTEHRESCVPLDGSKSSRAKPPGIQNQNHSPYPSPTRQLQNIQQLEATTKEGQVEGRRFEEKNKSDGKTSSTETSSGLQLLTSGPELQRVTEEEIKEELLLDVDIVTVGDQNVEDSTEADLAFDSVSQASHTASCQLQVETPQSSQHKSGETPTFPTQAENQDFRAPVNIEVIPSEIKQEEEEVEVERREGGRRRDSAGRSRRGRGGHLRGGKRRLEVDIMNETESEVGTEGCQVILHLQPPADDSQIKEEEGVEFCHRSKCPSLKAQEDGSPRREQGRLLMDATIPESCLPASLESSDEQIVFELESVTTSVEILKTEEGMEEVGPGEQGRGSRRCRSPSVLLERFLTGREREVEDTEQCQTELRDNNRLMDHTPLGFGVEGDLQSGADGMTLMGALRGQVIKVEECSSDFIPCQNAPRATATREGGAVVGQLDPCGQQSSGVRVFLVKEEDPLILDEPQAFPGHGHTQLTVEEMGPESNSHADREATSLEDREGRGDGDREEAASVSPLVLEAGVSGERCIVLRVKEEEREMALEPPQREHGLSVLLVSRAPGLDQQEDASQTEEGSLVSDLHPGPFADGGGFWVPMSSGCGTEGGVATIQECEDNGEGSMQIGGQQNEHVHTAEGQLNTEQGNTEELLEFLQRASDAEYSDNSDSEPEGETIAMACCYESRSGRIITPDEMSSQKQDHAKSNSQNNQQDIAMFLIFQHRGDQLTP